MSFDSITADALAPGQSAQVVAIRAGHGLALRLRSMGLRPGTVVRAVASGPLRGPILLELNGTRLALGRGVARRILVRPLS